MIFKAKTQSTWKPYRHTHQLYWRLLWCRVRRHTHKALWAIYSLHHFALLEKDVSANQTLVFCRLSVHSSKARRASHTKCIQELPPNKPKATAPLKRLKPGTSVAGFHRSPGWECDAPPPRHRQQWYCCLFAFRKSMYCLLGGPIQRVVMRHSIWC